MPSPVFLWEGAYGGAEPRPYGGVTRGAVRRGIPLPLGKGEGSFPVVRWGGSFAPTDGFGDGATGPMWGAS